MIRRGEGGRERWREREKERGRERRIGGERKTAIKAYRYTHVLYIFS